MAEETATGTQTTTETTATETVDNTDYKALYESMSAENTKLKGLNDKYCKEIKAHKEADRSKMTDDEIAKKELEETKTANAELTARIARFEAEKAFADGGFKSEEYAPIVDTMVKMGVCNADNGKNIADVIMGVINKRVADEKKLYENGATAKQTVKPSEKADSTEDSYTAFQKKHATTERKKVVI